MLYHKHYIRLDNVNRIIYGFSDAFEPPLDGDICISEQGGYQFRLWPDGEENPTLTRGKPGILLYRWDWDNEQVIPRTAEEIAADIAALPPPEPVITQEQLAALMLKQVQFEAEQQRFNADIMLAVAMAQEGGETIV